LIEILPYSRRFKLFREDQYFDYLKGKRVIIVGPADYLVGQEKGKEIDQYDIIVRLNLGCPVPKDLVSDLGSRTDILYHVVMTQRQVRKRPDLLHLHTKEEIRSWKNDGVKWVVSKRGMEIMRVRRLAEILNGEIPLIPISLPIMRRLELMIRTNPNMGTVAIYHILQSGVKSLYVTGCDFHRSGYHPGYGGFTAEQAAKGAGSTTCWGQIPQPPKGLNNMHDVTKQLKYLAQLRIRDGRFKADPVLSGMLDEVVL